MTSEQDAGNGSNQVVASQDESGNLDKTETLRPTIYWSILTFALLFPSILTYAYFVLLAHFPSSVQQAVAGVGKFVQFGFPAACFLLVMRGKPRWSWLGPRGIRTGLAFGAAVFAAMLMLYFSWLKSSGLLQGLELQVIEKVTDLGLNSIWKYAATGVFYALAHSLLEEYYWRWFVFGQLKPRVGVPAAIGISSLGFMAHHVILLATFFGWDSPLAYLFSLAVAIGGAVWAWIYSWSDSLLGPWLSHLLIDAAIFLIGFDLVHKVIW